MKHRLQSYVLLAIAASIVTLALKLAAYLLTNSVGLVSEAVESVVNLIAAVTAFFTLRLAALPADRNHTYGHEKIEFFSSGVEGFLIAAAGVGIVGYVLVRAGKRTESIVLEADGKHLLTDLFTSVGVVVGLTLVWLTHWPAL